MDAYEATKIVYSRIQGMDPDNAAKIMGLLLIQDHGEKEMIRLAFGPETLLQSVVLKARKELGLLPTTPTTPSSPSPFPRQQQTPSSSRLSSPSSWAPPPIFSRSNSAGSGLVGDEDDLLGPNLHYGPSPFYGGGDLIDELQLQEQLSFLNDNGSPPVAPKGELFYPELAPEWGATWGGLPRRSCSVADLYDGFGWKPCLYFARGFCKNGSACRFQHGLQDEMGAPKVDPVVEQQCQELLLRSKSQRLAGGTAQLMGSAAAAASFPYGSPAPSPTSGKCMSFLLQQQQSESQRAAVAAAALMLDEPHKFMGRSRIDYATMANPGSRQIYLTFPADSTFREEDVSNYFSIYGPVQDVRIPYQQKRMFGFVTFVYPETVKLILAKGNPHFVCDARVLVKPYKEKGKLPDKKHQQQQLDRGDFSGCSTPTGLDSRDPYELQQLGARFLFNSQEVLLRRKLEEQQQAADLQQAIELQSRRFMGLQLLDLKSRGISLPVVSLPNASPPMSTPAALTIPCPAIAPPCPDDRVPSPDDNKCASPVTASDVETQAVAVNPAAPAAGEEESTATAEKGSTHQDSDFQESAEHNLPDSPFASPIKSSCFNEVTAAEVAGAPSPPLHGSGRLLPATPTLDTTPSFKSCFLQMPRFSPGHGAVGM